MTDASRPEPARAVEKVVEIGAPVDAVWAALTTPEGLRNFRLTTGYGFEEIWSLGSLGVGDDGLPARSRGDIFSHGWFLRGQIDF